MATWKFKDAIAERKVTLFSKNIGLKDKRYVLFLLRPVNVQTEYLCCLVRIWEDFHLHICVNYFDQS